MAIGAANSPSSIAATGQTRSRILGNVIVETPPPLITVHRKQRKLRRTYLPQIYQRGLVLTVIDLQPNTIGSIDDGFHDTVNNTS